MDEGWWDPSQLPSALQSAPSSPVVPSKKQALLSSDGVKPLILHLLSSPDGSLKPVVCILFC